MTPASATLSKLIADRPASLSLSDLARCSWGVGTLSRIANGARPPYDLGQLRSLVTTLVPSPVVAAATFRAIVDELASYDEWTRRGA